MLEFSFLTNNVSNPDLPTPRPATSSRASSFRSSTGKVTPLRRQSTVSLIPETDASLDSTLKGEFFATAVLRILIKLKLTDWKLSDAPKLEVKNIASALTNSVFLIILGKIKFLLRIYGPNVLHLIDRDYETSVLARLAHHKIGPRLLGQFKNGRIEQWLESVEVRAQEIRIPEQSRYIARRLREFHDYVTLLPVEMGKTSAAVNLDSWIPALPKRYLGAPMKAFLKHIDLYRTWVSGMEGDIVFCHNDVQYGNLLRVHGDEHHSLAVIDFEYAGPNPRAFDIANHFCEWMADYHKSPSHKLDPAFYPSLKETNNFLEEYIYYGKIINRREDAVVSVAEVDTLRAQIDLWRAMSHAQWAIWGIIQSLPNEPAPNSNTVVSAPDATKKSKEQQQMRPSTSNSVASEKSERAHHSSEPIRIRRGSKTAQSPLVHGMRSPFLGPTSSSSPTVVKRTSSYKSPSYFPRVSEHVQAEDDDFTLGEPAILARSSDCWLDTLDDEDTNNEGEDSNHADESFDYTSYSNTRISLFYGELIRLGILSATDVPVGLASLALPPRCFP